MYTQPPPTRITLTLRAADGQTLEPIQPFVQIGAHVSIGRGLAVIDQVQPPALGWEPEVLASIWHGAPGEVGLLWSHIPAPDRFERKIDLVDSALVSCLLQERATMDRALVAAADERDQLKAELTSAYADKAAYAQNAVDLRRNLDASKAEVERLRSALKFYADREHYHFESGNWDTVSGEPLNILWNGEEPDFIEDGTVARNALAEGAKS